MIVESIKEGKRIRRPTQRYVCKTETENVNISSGGSCRGRGEDRNWNRKVRIEIEKDRWGTETDGCSSTNRKMRTGRQPEVR